MIHALKILPEYFEAVASGKKLFEIREEDREVPFQVGDFLALNEYEKGAYTRRCCLVEVVYVLRDLPDYVPIGKCVMGVYPCKIGRLKSDALQPPVYGAKDLAGTGGHGGTRKLYRAFEDSSQIADLKANPPRPCRALTGDGSTLVCSSTDLYDEEGGLIGE